MVSIDINCDVGEGVGNEQEIFPFISSCNIACGGHAGDEDTMLYLIRLAREKSVKIGAHPSYPDRDHFGRISLDLDEDELICSIREQLDLFNSLLRLVNAQLHHIKPHGALYNDLAKNLDLSKVFIRAIEPYIKNVKLYVPYGSVISSEAEKNNIDIVYECFADRNYNEDLSLVSRSHPRAMITDPDQVLNHVVQMAREGKVTTVTGSLVPIIGETFCVHGDTPSALQILMYLAEELPKERIEIAK